jgi:16S rRNA (cytosine1402-N4)-methyltransferase
MRHVPVLLAEVLGSLQLKPNETVIDCTLGDGGHSEAMLEATAPQGKLLGIDADPESLLRAKQHLYRFGDRVVFARDNFSALQAIVAREKFLAPDAILIDLGWSSPQFAERGRGFSFDGDEPLDMRYNPELGSDDAPVTAATIVNTYSVFELIHVFKQYGEENLSKEIAEAIATARRTSPIERTKQLVDIILQVYRTKLKSDKAVPWIGGIHPATKVFQALRIETNRELEVVKQVLPQAFDLLAKGGRLAIITFHSLEDRIVKQFYKTKALKREATLVNKKPVTASEAELETNPRARSAKLRVLIKN